LAQVITKKMFIGLAPVNFNYTFCGKKNASPGKKIETKVVQLRGRKVVSTILRALGQEFTERLHFEREKKQTELPQPHPLPLLRKILLV